MIDSWHLPAMIATHAMLTVWAYYAGVRAGFNRFEKILLEALADDEEVSR